MVGQETKGLKAPENRIVKGFYNNHWGIFSLGTKLLVLLN